MGVTREAEGPSEGKQPRSFSVLRRCLWAVDRPGVILGALMGLLPPSRYLLYWKGRLLEQPATEFCSVIKTNSGGPVGAFTDTYGQNPGQGVAYETSPVPLSGSHRETGELLPAV